MTTSNTSTDRVDLNEQTIRTSDPDGMYDHIRTFPEQLLRGVERAEDISPPCTLDDIDNVVLVGMGGSAISGDLLSALAEPICPVPIRVVRSYRLPRFVDRRTLVIVSSYSGNTEETLAGFEEALDRQAPVFCITSNGRVRERADRQDVPYLILPDGMPPRAALGYSLTAVVRLAEEVGLLDVESGVWEEAADVLGGLSRELNDFSGNDALSTARELTNLVPVVYSGAGLLAPVNLRWRCQFEENAERLAFGNLYPEWNHNEIMGWAGEGQQELLGQFGIITLKDRDDHPRVQERMETVRGLIEDRAGAWLEFSSIGEHPLTRMLSLVYLGDWTSLYLAVLRGVNPMSIRLIRMLKSRISQ